MYVLVKTVFWSEEMPAPLPSSARASLAVASATVSMAHLPVFEQAIGSGMFLPRFLTSRHRRIKV